MSYMTVFAYAFSGMMGVGLAVVLCLIIIAILDHLVS